MARVILGAFCGVLVFFVATFGGKIEGYFFPGVTLYEIKTIRPVGETFSEVTGEFVRPRDECSFDSQKWLSSAGTSAGNIDYIEGLVDREGGRASWGPWRLQMTPDQIMGARITVHHRCVWRLGVIEVPRPWLVETTFKPILDDVEVLPEETP